LILVTPAGLVIIVPRFSFALLPGSRNPYLSVVRCSERHKAGVPEQIFSIQKVADPMLQRNKIRRDEFRER
jgi:hypothetical protein